jgi:hypothetical protein
MIALCRNSGIIDCYGRERSDHGCGVFRIHPMPDEGTLAIGEPPSGTFFADIEARISSIYKAGAKRRLRLGADVAEPLDFGHIWRSPDCATVTHEVDCETAIYDFALPPRRPGSRQPQKLRPSRHLCPRLAFTLGQVGRLRQPSRVFRCARAVAGHRDTARHRHKATRFQSSNPFGCATCQQNWALRPDLPHRP